MTLRMLFVDDRRKRINYALKNFPDYTVEIAPNVPEALRALSSEDWDLVSLDCDLDGHDFQDVDEKNCGLEIARYIAKTGWPQQRHVPIFQVHSSNLFSANKLISELLKIGLSAYFHPIIYPVENMKYDEKGLPK